MLLNMPNIKKSTNQEVMFNLFVHGAFCKVINIEEICRVMNTYKGKATVTLSLNAFGQEVKKEISLKNLQKNMDNFFAKNVLQKVFLKFEYADAVATYQFTFSTHSCDVYFEQDLIIY